ncbi:MAG: DMT family transporter [Actinomycetota bacterium]|nr:DMT family transporter [Actinomycetota bacterium]MDH5314139.1 DMT family transporter [Actinomycetota bacterium]
MSVTRIAVTMSLVAGLAGAAQASVSGALGKRVGSVQAAAFGAIVAAVLLVGLAVVSGRGPGIADVFRQPLWLLISGVFGAGIVLTLAYAPPRIGTFATVALMIAGQLLAGAAIDAFGWLGTDRIPVTATRLIGLALLTAGAALTLRR